MYPHFTVLLVLLRLKYCLGSNPLPSALPGKCYSCSSKAIHKSWPQDASNRIQYLRQLPSFANESCDRVKNSLPVVSCHGSFCIKLVIINPSSFSRQICEPGPAIVRDCWSRVMWTDLDKNTFRKIIQEGSSKIQLMDAKIERSEGILYACNGYLCNGGTAKLSFIILILMMFRFFIIICM